MRKLKGDSEKVVLLWMMRKVGLVVLSRCFGIFFFFWGGYFCRGDLIIWSYILRGIAMNNGVLYIDLYEIRGSFFDIGSLDFDLDFDL